MHPDDIMSNFAQTTMTTVNFTERFCLYPINHIAGVKMFLIPHYSLQKYFNFPFITITENILKLYS